MPAWLSANLINIALVAVLVLIVALLLRGMIRDKRAGKSSCGGNCASCGACSGCSSSGKCSAMKGAAMQDLMAFSMLMILGVGVISIWDGFRSGFTFLQFFLRFVMIFTIYKIYDMICFDYFLLMKFKFFQHYYPEVESAYEGRKYGFNIKSQLLKLLVIFPAASALAARICTLFR